MSIKYPELFTPFNIGRTEIKNRIALAPMAVNGWTDADGNLTDESINYYANRAKGGTGLIITHSYTPETGNETSTLTRNLPFNNPDYFVKQGRKLVEKCHAYGSKVFFDVFLGMGRNIFPGAMAGDPVSASECADRWDPSLICKELTKEQIQNNIKEVIAAVVMCKQAGSDGICIDGAYGGYLADQFATDTFNRRTDEYGNDLDGKLRMVTTIIRGIKDACGENFPVIVRLAAKHHSKGAGQGVIEGEEYTEFGRDVEQSILIAKKFEEAGADALLAASGSYDSFYWLYPPMYQKEGLWIDDVAPITASVDIPVICPGRINQPSMANQAIKDGKISAVAIGRQLLADPEWANKAHLGKDEEIRPCIGCNVGCVGRCFGGLTMGCAVNAAAYPTTTNEIKPADRSKKVAVVGGGVAGMEAARIAAIRGHRVDLYEKADRLGGVLVPASVPSIKDEDRRLIKWFELQMKKELVNVHLNTEVTIDMLKDLDAEEIIISTGATEKIPPIPGADGANVLSAIKAFMNPDQIGKNVAIIGGGQVGCEIALWLKQECGKEPVILEAMPAILSGAPEPLPLTTTLMLPDLLKYHQIEALTNVRVQEISDTAVKVSVDNEVQEIPCDTVIMATGYKANDDLYRKASMELEKNVWRIGDADHSSNVFNAVRDGHAIGNLI